MKPHVWHALRLCCWHVLSRSLGLCEKRGLIASLQLASLRSASVALLLLLTLVTPLKAQSDSGDGDKTEAKTADREQTIYIPFSKLREVFEKEGRGVFLPYEQFQTLWKEARENRQAPPPQASPVDAIITSALNEATVQKDIVQVEATLAIELIKQGWIQLPLRLNEAAIQSATIDGEAARVTPAPGGGYQLLIENKTKEPRTLELKLKYARAFTKTPGRNSVAFDAPQAPVNRWRIRIPQAGVKVNVHPMIAATEAPNEGSEKVDSDTNKPSDPDAETIVLAFVGAAPQVAIDWTPKTEGATGMTALTVVQAQQELFITESTVRTRATLQYDISRAELTELSVEVPGDQKVVNVFDPNVRKWDVSKDGDNQIISVELFEPARAKQTLMIELEKYAEGEDKKDIVAARIRAVDVGRQQGMIVVNVDPALRAEPKTRTGLMQVDAAELPAAIAGQPWTFAYRYASLPFELTIGVEKIQPRITVDQLVESYLEPEQLSVDLLATYNIEEAGVFQLEFPIPTGFEILQVVGRATGDAAAVVVDSHHKDGENENRLIVNLTNKAIGKVAILLRMQQRLNDPNLLTPTGSASTIQLAIPQAKQAFIQRSEGRIVLHAPESLRVNPTATTGLRAISFSEAYQGQSSVRENRFPLTRPTLSFAFAEQAAQLELSAVRRKSQVTARQRLVVRIDSGVVRYESLIFYNILYSGVKSLRIDIPANLVADIRNTSGGLREAAISPPPADVPEGYVAWSLSGETELIGTQVVKLNWERKLEQLEVGKSLQLSVPVLKPAGTDRAWGQVVVTKTESLDVVPTGELTGLRPIDPAQDIMPDAAVPDAARAFEFHDDWSLTLTATRYQLEEVKRTSIERGFVRSVVTRSGQVGVQALYRIRSARQRLALQLAPEAQFDAQPARINGQPVALERGDNAQLFIPLIGQDPNTPFTLELRYSVMGSHSRIAVPEFPEDPAIQKIYLASYLPNELSLVGSSGPWTEEFTWTDQKAFKWVPRPVKTDDQLLAWVREGVNVGASPAFQTDGVMYLFSALRPAPSPRGDLRLWALDERWLALLIAIPVVVLGLLLLKSSFNTKVFAMAAVFVVVVACGIFVPTFARQLLNQPMYASLAIVAVAWLSWYLALFIKRFDWLLRQPRVSRPMFQPVVPVAPAASPDSPSSSSDNSGGQQND